LSYNLSEIKIIALPEGLFTVSRNKMFIPLNEQEPRATNRIYVGVTPFLIRTEHDNVLLDTGLGYETGGHMQILRSLQEQGLSAEQITQVVLSHLHKDHTGGCTYRTQDDTYHLTFPNATYYLQRRELDFALQQHTNPSFHHPTLKLLSDQAQVVLLDDDHGLLTDFIGYNVSSGHTPFHQTITIRDGEKTVFYGADELPQYSYLKNNFNYKNDFDGRKSMELRKKWESQAQMEHWTILFCHAKHRSVMEF
jgi:glyoxylase-like metal-dependent hydrolase (beta-lactamase superfamily II)